MSPPEERARYRAPRPCAGASPSLPSVSPRGGVSREYCIQAYAPDYIAADAKNRAHTRSASQFSPMMEGLLEKNMFTSKSPGNSNRSPSFRARCAKTGPDDTPHDNGCTRPAHSPGQWPSEGIEATREREEEAGVGQLEHDPKGFLRMQETKDASAPELSPTVPGLFSKRPGELCRAGSTTRFACPGKGGLAKTRALHAGHSGRAPPRCGFAPSVNSRLHVSRCAGKRCHATR